MQANLEMRLVRWQGASTWRDLHYQEILRAPHGLLRRCRVGRPKEQPNEKDLCPHKTTDECMRARNLDNQKRGRNHRVGPRDATSCRSRKLRHRRLRNRPLRDNVPPLLHAIDRCSALVKLLEVFRRLRTLSRWARNSLGRVRLSDR